MFGSVADAVISIPALMIAVILHEVAHGYVAYRMGDPTAKDMGRLTLNPIPHIDLFGTILIPGLLILAGSGIIFGWAKPVPINPANFRDLRKGMFFTSIAGVSMNIFLAFLFGAIYKLITVVAPFVDDFTYQNILKPLAIFCVNAVLINLVLAIFNIIPIPPLDGSKTVMSLVSFKYWELFYRYEVYGFFIITILLFTGILQKIIYPPLKFLYQLILG